MRRVDRSPALAFPRIAAVLTVAMPVMAMLAACNRAPEPGALKEIRMRGELRVVTINSPTTYYLGTHGAEGLEFGLAQAKARNNAEAIKEIESIAPYPGGKPVTRERIIIARKWPQFYGGLSAYRETSPYFFDAPLLSPEYDFNDRQAIDKGNVFTLGRIMPEFLAVDYTGVRSFPIPVVMFMGRHDYTTPSEPTAKWLEQVKAPYKRGIWFEHSAHMIPWEEPGKTLMSLVQYVRPLAGDANDAER